MVRTGRPTPGPSWTILNDPDPSCPSTVPSDDELLLSSQDMRDEIESTPPARPRKRKPTASESDDELIGRGGNSKKARVSAVSGDRSPVKDGKGQVNMNQSQIISPDKPPAVRSPLDHPIQTQIAKKRPPKRKPTRLIVEPVRESSPLEKERPLLLPGKGKEKQSVRPPPASQLHVPTRIKDRVSNSKQTALFLPSDEDDQASPVINPPAISQPIKGPVRAGGRLAVIGKDRPRTSSADTYPLTQILKSTPYNRSIRGENISTQRSGPGSSITAASKPSRPPGNKAAPLKSHIGATSLNAKESGKLQNKANTRKRLSSDSSSDDMPTDAASLLRDLDRRKVSGLHNASGSTSVAQRNNVGQKDMKKGPEQGITERKKKKKKKLLPPAPPPAPVIPVHAEKRKFKASQAHRKPPPTIEPIEISSDDSDRVVSTQAPVKRARKAVPVDSRDSPISLSDNDVKKLPVKFTWKEDADGSILIDDDEDNPDDALFTSPPKFAHASEKAACSGPVADAEKSMPGSSVDAAKLGDQTDCLLARSDSADELDLQGRSSLLVDSVAPNPDPSHVPDSAPSTIEDQMQDLDIRGPNIVDDADPDVPELVANPHHDAPGFSPQVLPNLTDVDTDANDVELATSVSSQLQIGEPYSDGHELDRIPHEEPSTDRLSSWSSSDNAQTSPHLSGGLHGEDVDSVSAVLGTTPQRSASRTEVGSPSTISLVDRDMVKVAATGAKVPPSAISGFASVSRPHIREVSVSLYSGSNGFFKNVFKMRAKSRPKSKDLPDPSPSPTASTPSGLIVPHVSSLGPEARSSSPHSIDRIAHAQDLEQGNLIYADSSESHVSARFTPVITSTSERQSVKEESIVVGHEIIVQSPIQMRRDESSFDNEYDEMGAVDEVPETTDLPREEVVKHCSPKPLVESALTRVKSVTRSTKSLPIAGFTAPKVSIQSISSSMQGHSATVDASTSQVSDGVALHELLNAVYEKAQKLETSLVQQKDIEVIDLTSDNDEPEPALPSAPLDNNSPPLHPEGASDAGVEPNPASMTTAAPSRTDSQMSPRAVQASRKASYDLSSIRTMRLQMTRQPSDIIGDVPSPSLTSVQINRPLVIESSKETLTYVEPSSSVDPSQCPVESYKVPRGDTPPDMNSTNLGERSSRGPDVLDVIDSADNTTRVSMSDEGNNSSGEPPSLSQEEVEEQEIASILNNTDIEMSDGQSVSPRATSRELRSRSTRSDSEGVAPLRRSSRSISSVSSSVGPASLVDETASFSAEPHVVNGPRSQGGVIEHGCPDLDDVVSAAGLHMVTYNDYSAMAKEMAEHYPKSEDIPHDLQDRINALSPAARRAGNMQVILFEAAIAENTAMDEPHAPEILILNDVDDELTPPFEFHYSNQMWHAEGVPKPDISSLRGCDCHGSCDPKSKTCICARRQGEYLQEPGAPSQPGFLYDSKRKLQLHDYPIFECNDFCGCSEDCINRVVQHGRDVSINIQKTANKGWGVFAGNKKIPANTFVGIYAGEYLTDAEAERRGSIYNKYGRTYLFDLDFYYLGQNNPDWESQYSIDAYHAGNFTRYLNHSCDPNCNINPCYVNEANLDKPLLTIFTRRDVAPGEELCFSYYGTADDADDSKNSDEDLSESHNYNDAVYIECRCGAVKCRKNMWR